MGERQDLRLPLLGREEAEGDAARVLASSVGHMQLFGLLSHASANVLPLMRLAGSILGKQSLAGPLREVAILVAMRLENGRYEWAQHVEIGRIEGLSDDDIAAIERLDLGFPADPAKGAVARFTRELVEDVRVGDEAWSTLAAHLGPREMVELMIAVGFYMMLARLTESAGLAGEEAQGAAVLASATKG